MAFEDRPFDDENQKQQSQQNPLAGTGSSQQNPSTQSQSQTTSAPSETKLTSGSSGTVGPGASATSAPNQKSSGRFTNLQNFITANQNFNAQGGGLAGKIGQNVANTQNKANSELQNAQQTFGQAVNTQQQGAQAAAQNAIGGIRQIMGSAPGTQNTEAINAVKSGLSTQYTGPEQLGNLERLQQNAQNLNSIQNATQTEGGRFGLLQKYFNKPTYTSGQQKLDQLFLQANPNQVGQLQQVARNAGTYNQNMQTATNQATQQAQQARDFAKSQQDLVTNQLNEKEKNYVDELNKQVADAQAAEQANAAKARSVNNTADISKYLQQAQALGIPLSKDIILKAAGTYNPGQVSLENINPEQLAIYNTLAGINNAKTYNVGNKFQQGNYGVDTGMLNQAFNAAQGYKPQVDQLQTQLDQQVKAAMTPREGETTFTNPTQVMNAALGGAKAYKNIAETMDKLKFAKAGLNNAFANIYNKAKEV